MISRSSIRCDHGAIVPLGEIVDFLDSMRVPVKESDRTPGPYPYFGANGQQGTINDFLFDEPLVLLAEDGGHFDDPDRGIAYRVSGRCWVNNHAHVLRPRRNLVDKDYLHRVLETYDISPYVTGTTRGKLTQAGAAQIPIPVPPLAEQRRIAAILDQADELRTKRRATLAKLSSLSKSVFVEFFGDPVSNPQNHPLRLLGDVCDVRDGTHDSPEYVTEGYPLVTSKNLRGGRVDLSDVSRISRDDYLAINRRSKVDRGDILLPMIGTIGGPVLVDSDPEYSVKNVAIIKFLLESPPAVFVHGLLDSHYFDHITAGSNRGGTQKFVSLGDLRRLPIPIPPDEAQHRYEGAVKAIQEARRRHETSRDQIDSLFASLQHDAFRGNL